MMKLPDAYLNEITFQEKGLGVSVSKGEVCAFFVKNDDFLAPSGSSCPAFPTPKTT